MFRQFIVTSVIAAAIMAAAPGRAAEIPHISIGYTGEELPKSSSIGITQAGILKAAMQVNPSELGDLDNLQIMGFSVGLASRINVSNLTVWAAESLDAEPFVLAKTAGRPEKGWNEINLTDYIHIPCQPFYIGYTIETSGTSYPVAVAGETAAGCLWLDNGNGWENFSDTAEGMLGMSVMITADNLPLYNLTLLSADIPSVMHSSVPTEIPVEIRNSGAMTVTGFSITCDEGDGQSQTFDISAVIKPNERFKTVLEVLPLSDESETPFEFTVAITSIDEGEDTNPADNSVSAMTRVSRFTFTKRLLVEEFTTMACVNCPRAAQLLHDALKKKEEYNDRVFGVCHHAGFYTDILTQPCDEEMLVLYGDPSKSYAPAMCFDRLELEQGAVAISVPLDVYDLTDMFDRLLSQTADVDLNVTAWWNTEINRLEIEVEGGSATGTVPQNAERITVYVLENDINTPQQAGGGANYMQQHVIRAYNATWGEEIDWKSDGRFNYVTSFELPSDIVPEHIVVIGLISHYNPDNQLDCAVGNSARAPYIDWNGWADVDGISAATYATEICYDLFGRRVSPNTKGVVIKVRTRSDGSRTVIKTLNR